MEKNRPLHVVVLGGGFAGLSFCRDFEHPHARITLVDRQNHHLFQPLLYQVATAGLSAPEIAQPIRSILAERKDITVLMDSVRRVDLKRRRVELDHGQLDYDRLVIGLGGRTSYFGHDKWEEHAPGLKTLDDATHIRRRLLLAFEQAETETDPAIRKRLLTMVVVGGGPTGVELAGAFVELSRHVLKRDFRRIDPTTAKVILVEAGPRILPMFSEELSRSALEQLEALGVEVRLNTLVKDIGQHRVRLSHDTLEAGTIVWAAGVAASPITQGLGVPLDRAGRIQVEPDLSLPGHPEAFAAGDLAGFRQKDGAPVPGVAPAAMQMGTHVARLLEDELDLGSQAERRTFEYWDKGSMATIGRSAAVLEAGRIKLTGLMAWLGWLFVHIVFLIGFRNRLKVFLEWVAAYFAYGRGARIITGLAFDSPPEEKPKSPPRRRKPRPQTGVKKAKPRSKSVKPTSRKRATARKKPRKG